MSERDYKAEVLAMFAQAEPQEQAGLSPYFRWHILSPISGYLGGGPTIDEAWRNAWVHNCYPRLSPSEGGMARIGG